jgi:hypothetical protein
LWATATTAEFKEISKPVLGGNVDGFENFAPNPLEENK